MFKNLKIMVKKNSPYPVCKRDTNGEQWADEEIVPQVLRYGASEGGRKKTANRNTALFSAHPREK